MSTSTGGKTVRVGLVTMRDKPAHEADDRHLVRALQALGAIVEEPVWNDGGVAWAAFDACVVRTTWDYHERRDEFVAWAERVERSTRLFNCSRTIRWNTDKRYLRQLADLGVRLAPTLWLEQGERFDAERVRAFLGGRRGFLKPAVGLSASDTLPFAADGQGLRAAAAHAEPLLLRMALLVQPFLASVTAYGELSFLHFGGEFSHAVRKIPVPGDYRVMDDYGATDVPHVPTTAELGACAGVLGALERIPELRADRPLYARLDFLHDDDGRPCLNELELVEPSLFFRHASKAAERFAAVILAAINSGKPSARGA